jgi:hypothetical protein
MDTKLNGHKKGGNQKPYFKEGQIDNTINNKILSKKIEMCELNQKMEVNSDITEG